jgi:hypothetical protein
MDDGERFNRTALLLVHAMLATLGVLGRENMLIPNSPIPNISLMVALFFRWLHGLELDDEEDHLGMIVAVMEKHNMAIAGLHNMDHMDEFEAADDEELQSKTKGKLAGKDQFKYLASVSVDPYIT